MYGLVYLHFNCGSKTETKNEYTNGMLTKMNKTKTIINAKQEIQIMLIKPNSGYPALLSKVSHVIPNM